MDFYRIVVSETNKEESVFPDFITRRSRDLMIRGKSFYAIWDAENEIWSMDEEDVSRLIDEDLERFKQEYKGDPKKRVKLRRMSNFSSKSWTSYRSYLNQMFDTYKQLDEDITFSNTKTKKTDYVSRRLPYPLEKGSIDAYDEIMRTLYDSEEREKLEWAIGSIVAGDAKNIQKFIVLYGASGSGKSTFLNILQKLFVGYYTVFKGKSLGSNNGTFSTAAFKNNPLVAIEHDGDLSRIEDNTTLNSIISHEEIRINEKNKPEFISRLNCFLFMGTNKPVKITDSKSGIIRRLIDVRPSSRLIETNRYHQLVNQIDFELGAIAHHCLKVYKRMGKDYYSNYTPFDMMFQTDVFFNFVEDTEELSKDGGITLKRAYEIYKLYCDETSLEYKLPRHKFREELKSYFKNFEEVTRVDGIQKRSYYSGFISKRMDRQTMVVEKRKTTSLILDSTTSLLDDHLSNSPAQYATSDDIPSTQWSKVCTTLKDLDTRRVHYVRPLDNHIVIDFDLVDEQGNKSLELNLQKSSEFPNTYAEISKGGAGVHLHYIWDGDISRLQSLFEDGIEIKTFTGKSSLRRRLTKCNNIPIAIINSGLPLKGEKPLINNKALKSEKGLRDMIKRNLNKEFLPGTKPSIDFIHKILEDAYNQGLNYDVKDLRSKVLAFANNSSNQADYCIKKVNDMKFVSGEISKSPEYTSEELVFFDVEVYPNLLVVVWMPQGKKPVKLINPSPNDIESILNFKLIGFNCRRYDNHILYARLLGWDNQQLYELSQKIINNNPNALFNEAYNLSYTDIYDFSSAANKKGLKKWEIELGLYHMEMGIPWGEPVPEEIWPKVVEYCTNDVLATEAVFNHLAGDWAARQILASLSGLSLNDTTNSHTTKIVFGDNKNPQSEFENPDLSELFPGYVFDNGKSTYRGIDVGEGGLVIAKPGMYENVDEWDIGGQHPNSIEQMNLFGPYTKKYIALKNGREAIKHNDIELLSSMFDGKLIPYIEEAQKENPKFTMKDVSTGLKTANNSVYGLTFAGFPNPFKDPRNKDNKVAKRGSLFMVDLMFALADRGVDVIHIKTDSVKVTNNDPAIREFIIEFAKGYGYTMEHEATYSKFCLVNDAVFISKNAKTNEWKAVGTQFKHPYVFKTLFSKKAIEFSDLCEAKTVKTSLHIDMGENDLHFVGKVGNFCPIKPNRGGGKLVREKDGKYYAATGTKGYFWLESETVKNLGKQDDVDLSYFDNLVDAAIDNINKYGDFYDFVGEKKRCHGLCNSGGDCTNCTNCTCPANKDAPPWCDGVPCPNYNSGDCDHCYDDKSTPLHCLTSDCAKCPKSINGGDCLPF